jgi:NAD(P)-dependent dehydrogenase (short-subunit alcohol dehydrogenase family)
MSEGHSPATVEGKNAVVIGGTSGIGQSIALGFAEEGADVIATSRTESAVEETAEMLRERGATTAEVTCDVTEMETLDNLVDVAEEELGGVDVLVNSGGAIARQRVDTVTEEEWDFVTDVQLDGVYRAIQAFSDALAAGDGGAVVNISSLASTVAMEDLAAYSAAKGGVDSLTRVAARELAPEVRVNAVAPGYVITPQNADTYAEGTEKRQRIDERSALGRVAEREEIVGPTVFLASDAASYTTGEVVTVDGGFADGAF